MVTKNCSPSPASDATSAQPAISAVSVAPAHGSPPASECHSGRVPFWSVPLYPVVSIFSFLAIITGILGVINLFAFRAKSKGGQKRKMAAARKWHRRLGIFALLFYFMFGISAFYHVVYKFTGDDSPTWASSQSVVVSSLTTPLHHAVTDINTPVNELSLAVVDGIPLYRFAVAKRSSQPVYFDASTGQKSTISDASFATALALEFSGYSAHDIDKVEPIFKFRNDYGFIFKRLPVWRVQFKNQEYWHYTVDTADAHMAMRMKPASLAETLSFINLHKLHFLDGLGKSTRDWVSVIAALSIALISIFGLLIVVRKRKSSPL